jgi:hypothetical protein
MLRLYRVFSHIMGGEPEDLWVFDASAEAEPSNLHMVSVPVWVANEQSDITAFNTLGMSEAYMPGADYFCELNLGYRGSLEKPQRERMARFLANIFEYPFANHLKLDVWETIRDPGAIPFFPGCRHLLVSPPLDSDFQYLDDPDGLVKWLFLIPITPRERHLLLEHGRDAFLDHCEQNDVDLFADRTDPPEWYAQDK